MKNSYPKQIIKVGDEKFDELIRSADAFVCGAGFEDRAEKVPLNANVSKNPIIITFKNGPIQNDQTFSKFRNRFEGTPGYDVCVLDLIRIECFEADFERAVRNLKNLVSGKVIIDVSGLPNFAVCIIIVTIRKQMPKVRITLLHTEAEDYFPIEKDYTNIVEESRKQGSLNSYPGFLSDQGVNLYIPRMFSGVALGHNDTCLLVFAGYEPHRTSCVIEALNPSKLVMIYGLPARKDLQWRLELSKIMHRGVDPQIMKVDEESSASEIDDNLQLLLEYYEYLYDDHVLSICPINSKMQAVASALAWETYPDIQLVFPIPITYLPKTFSVKSRDTFLIDLGLATVAQRFYD